MTIVRADIVKKVSFKKYTIGEDVLYHMSILWAHPQTCLLSAPICFYRKRGGSAVNGAVSKEKVLDLLQTEYEMLQLYEKNRSSSKIENVAEYYRWNEDFVWYTFARMFFRLPSSERQELLSHWVDVQKLQHKVLAPSLYKKLVLCVLKVFPSARLCKVLVCGPVYLRGKFYGLARRLIAMQRTMFR